MILYNLKGKGESVKSKTFLMSKGRLKKKCKTLDVQGGGLIQDRMQ